MLKRPAPALGSLCVCVSIQLGLSVQEKELQAHVLREALWASTLELRHVVGEPWLSACAPSLSDK